MSKNDREKEQNENNCLRLAIEFGAQKKTKTGEIMRFLDGETIQREKSDSPDIIKKCLYEKNKRPVYVGIEHFLVDQASTEKGSKYKEGFSCIQKIYEEGHEKQKKGEGLTTVGDKLVKEMSELAAFIVSTDYKELMASFKKKFNKHLKRADVYRNKVREFAGDDKVELAFLMEVHTFLPDVFLWDEKGWTQNTSGLLPMFEEIVEELKQGSPAVDYFIFVLKDFMNDDIQDVIAIKSGNIKKHLNEQNIQVYKYFQGIPSEMKITGIQKDKNKNYIAKLSSNVDYSDADYINTVFEKVYNARKNKITFAVPRLFQKMLELLDDGDVKFFQNSRGGIELDIKPQVKIKVLEQLYVEELEQSLRNNDEQNK